LPCHPDAQLTIVGTGALRAELEAYAGTLGITGRVVFAGHRHDIENLLREANIGVLPSFAEGLSNTLLESMAAGLPMVASRVSGNEDLVRNDENGWLFEPGDRTQLAQRLEHAAMLSPDQRVVMGDCARRTVHRHAGLESVLDQLIVFYQGACGAAVLVVPRKREA